MKKKYNVKLSPFYDVEFIAVWEIDFDFKNFSDSLKEANIKSVKDAILLMNDFWSDAPDKNDSFEEHLDYFLTHATLKIHQIYQQPFICEPRSLTNLTKKLFNEEEGFCIGECGIKLIEFIDEFELTQDDLWVSEK
ncbi:hypothetical protein NYR75_02765 [Actinobacillus equuli subsp. haemolyticus]|uniref:Uncharacterized protein n=1 Tax=Actinobacillus equuli subsp. equuli TaxID=202947 RepID=A0A9X4JD63_ACTEU|nr:hypothetical protein [Actinobacillus equuli]MDE8034618.1 hypothetical protein [Actinobacillus equuli subsp. equuli]MDG4948746.1 hypothetical protein [Actinobacillus equuli subsp. haemolyticus]WGE63763.1 hypothetical protein NYR75_02765 [Actinobacillus equuli subsp. haemolyticus]